MGYESQTIRANGVRLVTVFLSVGDDSLLQAARADYTRCYLQTSIPAFPGPEAFAAMMREAGLEDVTVRRFNFGGTDLYVGRVPRDG